MNRGTLRKGLKVWGWIAAVALPMMILVTVSAAGTPPAATRPAPQVLSAQELRRVIRELNHPAVTRRRAAIRQLAEWGPLAFGELRAAAKDQNLESALSARELLKELEGAVLIGARVRLEASNTSVKWNEPFSLTVIAENPTSSPIRIPWATPATQPAANSKAAEVHQVAAMMDAADFLVVVRPDGKPLESRVEPIDRDTDVFAAVDSRARGSSPTQDIEPGRQARLSIPLFNRGWARYPMLRKGSYKISFAYQPKWKDESWTEQNFGQVTSEPITVEVTEAAPATLLKATTPLEMRLERSGDSVQAVVLSHWDVPVWLNLNLGSIPLTHSRMEWQLTQERQDNAEPFDLTASTTPPDFDGKRVAKIDPAGKLIAASIPVSQVRKGVEDAVHQRQADYAITVKYAQLATPVQLHEELARLGKPQDVPVHMFSGVLTSEEVSVNGLLKAE